MNEKQLLKKLRSLFMPRFLRSKATIKIQVGLRTRKPPPRFVIRVRQKRRSALVGTHAAYKKHKETARELVHRKLTEHNAHYALAFGKVAIRNQRTRWGSCSKKGNLNFHYRIALLPEHLADYVIVHELCHLAEFNHSKKFWSLVAQTIPDHRARRKVLKGYTTRKT